MTFTEYQVAASRTIDTGMSFKDMEDHALHGMVSELGEIHGAYQKVHQKHEIDVQHLKKEVGDLLWFIAEFCTACEWSMDEVASLNIQKLLERYPNGFEAERSLHRDENDI